MKLSDPDILIVKGIFFALSGTAAGVFLWYQTPTITTAALLVLTVWCFCRFYYLAFYVITHYIDDRFRYTGLIDFFFYVIKRRSP